MLVRPEYSGQCKGKDASRSLWLDQSPSGIKSISLFRIHVIVPVTSVKGRFQVTLYFVVLSFSYAHACALQPGSDTVEATVMYLFEAVPGAERRRQSTSLYWISSEGSRNSPNRKMCADRNHQEDLASERRLPYVEIVFE